MKTWLKVLLIILVLVIIGGLIFVFGTVKKGKNSTTSSPRPTQSYENNASDQAGFELKKSSSNYTVYYHSRDDTNADKTLAVLGDAVNNYYKKYYNLSPKNTSVYLAQTVDEYAKIADFPGGKENVQVGDGSAPNGKIYLYKPFEDPEKGKGVIVHEGAHAAINDGLGGGQMMENMPGFINEGMAYFVEYVHNTGENFDPIKEIYFTDILKKAAKSGNPPLMSLDELGKNCQGYMNDETTNGLCRGQGTFLVWYMEKNYSQDPPAGEAGFWGKFLTDLKSSSSWQKSLEKVSGKTLSDIGQEVDSSLESLLK